MKRSLTLFLAIISAFVFAGCTRIETGEVGLRRQYDKTVNPSELQPGSLNQTIIGEVLTFPVRDIAMEIENKTPLTADNSALKDFDVTAIYSINPSSVNELYTQKSMAFHYVGKEDIYLMFRFIETLVNNAAYKSIRQYKALEVADNRAKIEAEIRAIVTAELNEQKLSHAITIGAVQVRNVLPSDDIIRSANELVRAQNELKTKEIEVQTARKEAERVAALNANGNAISYMQAQAGLTIAEAIKAGKVNTIVVPQDFKGIVNVGK